MVSQEEQLCQELREARQALQYQKTPHHQFNELFELETKIHIEENDWLLNLDESELEKRVERLERDLEDLKSGGFRIDD